MNEALLVASLLLLLYYRVVCFENMATPHRESLQKQERQIQQDWANREYIEVITTSIKKITDFLNSFDLSCRSKLAVLNEKLSTLERKIDYLEACVTKGETLT